MLERNNLGPQIILGRDVSELVLDRPGLSSEERPEQIAKGEGGHVFSYLVWIHLVVDYFVI